MKVKTPKAVYLISFLSLLLGLSIGQNHRQYLRITQLEESLESQSGLRRLPPTFDHLGAQMEALRHNMEMEVTRLEREKHFHLRELHREMEMLRREFDPVYREE